MINGHGNNLYQYLGKVKADFSSNVFNHPKTEYILEHVKEQLNSVKNYPDCECRFLRNRLAEKIGIRQEYLHICNGSTEAFYLLAHVYKKSRSVIPVPSFSEYEDACALYEHKIEFPPNNINLDSTDLAGKLVWLGNPNNPDGKYIRKHELIHLLSSRSDTIFIIDEAYIELCKDAESLLDEVERFSNLVLIKSFTKLYAVPGIRLGYMVAQSDVIESVKRVHMPWAVNSLALKVGEHIVSNFDGDSFETKEILAASQRMQEELSKVPGINIINSPTNYFLVKLECGAVQDLQDYLMKEYGFLIRNAANFRGLDNTWTRLASQGEFLDSKLIIALKEWVHEKNEVFTDFN